MDEMSVLCNRVRARIELSLNRQQKYMTDQGAFKDLKEFSSETIGKKNRAIENRLVDVYNSRGIQSAMGFGHFSHFEEVSY